jgi:hypothetical protein
MLANFLGVSIKNLNVRPKTLKLLQQNPGKTLEDIGLLTTI